MNANHDDTLKQYLYSISFTNKNAMHTSPRIQNKVIEIIGNDIIYCNIIEEIKAAQLK